MKNLIKIIDILKKHETPSNDNQFEFVHRISYEFVAKEILEQLALTEVDNRRELLKAFKEWERWDYKKTYDTPTDEIVSDYLSL